MRVCSKCAPSVQVCGGDSRHGGYVCRGAPRALRCVVCRAPRARSSIGLSARLVSPCESRRRHGTRAPRRGAAPAIATASARARARKRLASSSPRTEACSRDQGSSCSAQRPDQSGRAWCACKRHTQWSRRGETRAGALALVGTSGAHTPYSSPLRHLAAELPATPSWRAPPSCSPQWQPGYGACRSSCTRRTSLLSARVNVRLSQMPVKAYR